MHKCIVNCDDYKIRCYIFDNYSCLYRKYTINFAITNQTFTTSVILQVNEMISCRYDLFNDYYRHIPCASSDKVMLVLKKYKIFILLMDLIISPIFEL